VSSRREGASEVKAGVKAGLGERKRRGTGMEREEGEIQGKHWWNGGRMDGDRSYATLWAGDMAREASAASDVGSGLGDLDRFI